MSLTKELNLHTQLKEDLTKFVTTYANEVGVEEATNSPIYINAMYLIEDLDNEIMALQDALAAQGE